MPSRDVPENRNIPLIEASPVPLAFNQNKFIRDLSETTDLASVFKKAIEDFDCSQIVRFRQGENVRSLVHERALFTDCLLHFAWHQYEWSDTISLVAVGGYGRGELHPKSDIDILILLDNKNPEQHTNSIESFLMLLWDIGLNIGHGVRTLDQCFEIASQDISVFTNILESRTLKGSTELLSALQSGTHPNNMWSYADFFQAKRKEQTDRHQKYNHTEYNLEPNVKNAPGGLRDLQNIQWVSKHYFGVKTLKALQNKNFFTEAEFSTFLSCEEFLWKVRFGLHTLTSRPEERLLFDFQKELAQLFGYADENSQLAIEKFMHEYFRVVLSVRALNDILLQHLDEAIINLDEKPKIKPINDRFQLNNQYIEAIDENVFKRQPSSLLEVFVIAANTSEAVGIRASTIRLIRDNANLIDDNFRNTPKNTQLFVSLLQSPHRLVTQLRTMRRYGILGRYLPEFNHIIGQMQYDLFHIYTVDAHTLNTIRIMRQFFLPIADERFPFPASVAKQLPKIELLYIAGLFHDIGKGRGGDHSELGAVDVELFSKRHNLSKRDTRLVTWLVRNHLIMSTISQKQDISDPDVIHAFAEKVGDQNYLNYLFALTVADMNATNPDIWNHWRASLLQKLYRETLHVLNRGLENPIDKAERIAETQESAMIIAREQNRFDEQAIWELWQTAGDMYFLKESPKDIIWHTYGILSHKYPEEPLILITESKLANHSVTQIFVRAKSSRNIFAAVTSALDSLNLNIQDARIYSTISGYTMDTFYVLDHNGYAVSTSPESINKLINSIETEINLVGDYREIISRRTPRVLKHFNKPTRAIIRNDLSNQYSILEINSPDRPGLLARLARIFVEFNVGIIAAKISTLGERVEDIFYITDKEGNRLSDPTLCQDLQDTICKQLDENNLDNFTNESVIK